MTTATSKPLAPVTSECVAIWTRVHFVQAGREQQPCAQGDHLLFGGVGPQLLCYRCGSSFVRAEPA